MTTIDKLNFITSIKYKAWGHRMIGIFRGQDGWFVYFRNPDDEYLQALDRKRYNTFEECVDAAYEDILKWKQLQEGK